MFVRLAVLSLLLLPPAAYWPAWQDAFALPKELALAGFGALAVVLGAAPRGAWGWTAIWALWCALAALASPVPAWRSGPEVLRVALPAWVGAAAGAAAGPAKAAAAVAAAGAAAAAVAVAEALGVSGEGWLSPFHKGVASVAGNPDLLGGSLLPPFAVAASACATAAPRGWRAAAPAAVLAALVGAAIVLSEARAAWLGAAVAAAGALAGAPPRVRAGAWLVGAVLVAAVLARPGVLERAASGGALVERAWTWRRALEAIREAPLLGAGPGGFRRAYLARQADATARDPGARYHYTEYAHLEPLHLAVETGLPGAGLFAWGVACAWRGWRRSAARLRSPAAWRAAGAAGAAVATNALFSWPWHVPATILPCWILLGACAPPPGAPPRLGSLRLAGALGAALAVLAAGARLGYGSGALRLGQALAAAGRPADALAAYARALRLADGDVRLSWAASAAARAAGRPDEAAARIEHALALEPDLPDLHRERAAVEKALGRPGRAEAALRTAIRLDPRNPDAWNNLGNLLGALGRLAEAEAAHREAVRLAPEAPEPRRNLAVTLSRAGKRAEAARILAGGAP